MVNFTSMKLNYYDSYSGYIWLAKEQDGLLSMLRHNRKMRRRNDDGYASMELVFTVSVTTNDSGRAMNILF